MNPVVDVIHVGFPKTGTTWLQRNLLPNVPEFALIGKPYLISVDFRDFLNRFVSANDFDFSPEEFRGAFLKIRDQHQKHFVSGKTSIVSFELLSGDLYTGDNAKVLLDRIKKTFGPCKIIITIREQRAMIESLYRHYIDGGGNLHIREFLYRRNSPSVDMFKNEKLFEKFRYDKYIQYAHDLFGPKNVSVIPFEWLRNDSKEYAKRFLLACGLTSPEFQITQKQENPSSSYLGIQILRIFNQFVSTPYSDSFAFRPMYYVYTRFSSRIFSRLDRNIFSKVSLKTKFIDRKKYFLWELAAKAIYPSLRRDDDEALISRDIADRYKSSNQATAQLTALPLETLGYYLG